jgi:hypothetical protein
MALMHALCKLDALAACPDDNDLDGDNDDPAHNCGMRRTWTSARRPMRVPSTAPSPCGRSHEQRGRHICRRRRLLFHIISFGMLGW